MDMEVSGQCLAWRQALLRPPLPFLRQKSHLRGRVKRTHSLGYIVLTHPHSTKHSVSVSSEINRGQYSFLAYSSFFDIAHYIFVLFMCVHVCTIHGYGSQWTTCGS